MHVRVRVRVRVRARVCESQKSIDEENQITHTHACMLLLLCSLFRGYPTLTFWGVSKVVVLKRRRVC